MPIGKGEKGERAKGERGKGKGERGKGKRERGKELNEKTKGELKEYSHLSHEESREVESRGT